VRAPKEVPLGDAPKEVPLGDAPKEVTLGGGGMSFLRLDLRDFLLAALARGAVAFLLRFDFDFLARGIMTSVGRMTA